MASICFPILLIFYQATSYYLEFQSWPFSSLAHHPLAYENYECKVTKFQILSVCKCWYAFVRCVNLTGYWCTFVIAVWLFIQQQQSFVPVNPFLTPLRNQGMHMVNYSWRWSIIFCCRKLMSKPGESVCIKLISSWNSSGFTNKAHCLDGYAKYNLNI